MKEFKFLSDDDNEDDDFLPIPDNTASWMWADETPFINGQFNKFIPNHRWVIEQTTAFGILEFLERFPDNSVVMVHSIEGNGIRHTSNETGRGWGFDIRATELTIEYYKLISTD